MGEKPQLKTTVLVVQKKVMEECAILVCTIVLTKREKMRVIQNFNKGDCVHFNWSEVQSCCGRTSEAGVCGLTDNHKMCYTKAKYCKYQRRDEDVHSKKLSDTDGRNSHSN